MSGWLNEILGASKTRASASLRLSPQATAEQLGVTLPEAHMELLKASDGLVLYDGYFRFFSIENQSVPTIAEWNGRGAWKFAWPAFLDDFLFLGETAWGDQYAYRLDELTSGVGDAVYFLDAFRMGSRKLAPSFVDFAMRYLTRNAVDPFDSMLRQAYEKFGPLPVSTHLVHAPSILLTGEEHLDNVITMNDRQAMIVNGDMWSQLSSPPDGAVVERVEVVTDDQGRGRMKVVWGTQAVR